MLFFAEISTHCLFVRLHSPRIEKMGESFWYDLRQQTSPDTQCSRWWGPFNQEKRMSRCLVTITRFDGIPTLVLLAAIVSYDVKQIELVESIFYEFQYFTLHVIKFKSMLVIVKIPFMLTSTSCSTDGTPPPYLSRPQPDTVATFPV